MNSLEEKEALFTGDATKRASISGGRFDFEDGGTYCGGWDDGKAHGHGVCTGPKHQGAFSGAWSYGFEVSGAYIWPSGSHYVGQWQNGRRHGLGVEQIGRQIYRGEWSKDGHKGRYGTRESMVSTARYEGTWNMGYQDGYGCETYADGGKYQGQWQEGKRHGYGIRTSAPFGLASHYRRKDAHSSLSSLRSSDTNEVDKMRSEEVRGGFVLTAKSDKTPIRRNSLTEKPKKGFLSGFKIRKQKSTGDLEKRGTLASSSVRSTTSTSSWLSTGSEQSNLTSRSTHTDSNASFTMEDEHLDSAVIETYMGEWKKDKRCGHGVAERSDGLRYEGEWYGNKKHGYGVTTFRDGAFEEGKYKNNVLITSQKKKHLFLARSRKFRDRINVAVNSAQRALKMAMQRSDIAISRTSTASDRAQNANIVADQALVDCENAVKMAREFAPDFKPSVLERFEKLRFSDQSKFVTLMGNSNLVSYSCSPEDFQKHLPLVSELNKSKNNRRTLQELDLQMTNSIDYQKHHVTPQTDFVDLINQQSQPGNIRLDKAYYSHPKINTQLSTQQEETIQQKEIRDFNRSIGSGKSKTDGENNSLIFSQTMQQNGSIEKYERTKFNNINYIANSNFSQQNGNKDFPSEEDAKRISNDQALINKKSSQYSSSSVNYNSSFQQQQPIFNETDQPLSIDYFDHYKRPPSRDSSTDRYGRATSRLSENLGNNSRQTSIDMGFSKQTKDLASSHDEAKTRERSTSRTFNTNTLTASINPSTRAENKTPQLISQPFEDIILCKRSLGQDIIPSVLTPKRTESLYTPPAAVFLKTTPGNNFAGSKPRKNIPTDVSIQRKKSLPDFQDLPRATGAMSREEVSTLGSARREAVRRQIQINERLRANPLLYLFSPQVKVLDDKNVRRRFRASNYQSTTRVKPFICTMPMRLDEGWNQIQFNLSDFTRRAYGTNYVETLRVQIHANCRIRRVYFSDRLYSEEELPPEFKLFLPIQKPQKSAYNACS